MHPSLFLHFCLFCIVAKLSSSFAPYLLLGVRNGPSDPGRPMIKPKPNSASSVAASIQSAGLVFSQEDPILQSARRTAFERLQSTIQSLADFEGVDRVKLIHNDDLEEGTPSIPINSLVFQVTSHPDPILIIAPTSDRVDTKKLEAYLEQGDDDERISTYLVPPESVEQLCGFPPKSVPPLGHIPRNFRTLVDIQLVQREGVMLLGGGGHPTVSCKIAVETLLMLEGTEVADICSGSSSPVPPPISLKGTMDESGILVTKPFFPIAPPDAEMVKYVIQNPDETNPLQPQPVTIVGRISGVRRMARRLVFCDLAPPNYIGSGSKLDSYDQPWTSGTDGKEMAVQLIAGKTFCKSRGEVDGPELLRSIRPGQLVLVEGKTNVGNRESLGHWVDKRSLDIVVWDYQILGEDAVPLGRVPRFPNDVVSSSLGSTRKPHLLLSTGQAPETTSLSNNVYLKLSDIFSDPTVHVVDNLEGIAMFAHALETVSSGHLNGDSNSVSMVGIDCEWKPSFMLKSPSELQPVLLLQISIQKLQTVYLLDLQTLLRPCLHTSVAMNEVESATSRALSQLFASTQFLKLGFQLLSDLRRLAGSYPHVDAFRVVHAVVEVSVIAQKTMQLAKIRNARHVITSLSRLTQFLLDKPLDKEQQISDWSLRPLTHAQQQYSSLDAAVGPVLFERALKLVDADWLGDGLKLGRWKDDASFMRSVSSIRFIFLDDQEPAAVQKLKAKKVVSDQYIVTQTWAEGHEMPTMPSLPSKDGEGYTDVSGIRRIPSLLVSLRRNQSQNIVTNLIGKRVGRSKESCLQALLFGNLDMPVGSRLEYPQRAGYVEFTDGVALFVNMPVRPGDPSPRGYPNFWLDDGKSMTWFLRENEWNQGTSRIAKKLVDSGIDNAMPNRAILFVRMGRGDFLCCGHCRVSQQQESKATVKDWGLEELFLDLLDWTHLQNCLDFTSMACKLEDQDADLSNEIRCDTILPSELASVERNDNEIFPSMLAGKVIAGNVVEAMALALLECPENEKSIGFGLQQLTASLRSATETSPIIESALLKLSDLSRQFDN